MEKKHYCLVVKGWGPNPVKHEYAERVCPRCGRDFCYTCCASTNVDVANRYGIPPYMLCPECGHDIYEKETP